MARILVVDDDDLVLRLFTDIFQFLGHDVTALPDGRSALAYIEATHNLDLLVTDIVMPNMSGDDLVNEVLRRSDLPQFPIQKYIMVIEI